MREVERQMVREREREGKRATHTRPHLHHIRMKRWAGKAGGGWGGWCTDFDGHWVVADDKEIFGLQIKMNDVFLVHVDDTFEDLTHYALHLLLRKGALNQSLEELSAFHILHHQHIRVSVLDELGCSHQIFGVEELRYPNLLP